MPFLADFTFSLRPQHDLNYLLITWLALIATIIVLGILTGYLLKRNDTRV